MPTANQLPTSDAEDDDGYDYSDEEDHLGPGSRRVRRSYRARHFATRSTRATAHVPHRRIKAPHLHETLVLCYLGCVWLRQPITLTDLLVYVQKRSRRPPSGATPLLMACLPSAAACAH